MSSGVEYDEKVKDAEVGIRTEDSPERAYDKKWERRGLTLSSLKRRHKADEHHVLNHSMKNRHLQMIAIGRSQSVHILCWVANDPARWFYRSRSVRWQW